MRLKPEELLVGSCLGDRMRTGMLTSGQDVELRSCGFCKHVCVQQTCDRSAGGVACHEEGTCAAGRIFFQQGSKTGGDWLDHLASDRKKA